MQRPERLDPYAQMLEARVAELEAEVMRLNERIIALETEREHLLATIRGLLRGKTDVSQVARNLVLMWAEAYMGIVNAAKNVGKPYRIPWTQLLIVIAVAGVIGLLYSRPEYIVMMQGWLSNPQNQIFAIIALVVFGVIMYYLFRRRR